MITNLPMEFGLQSMVYRYIISVSRRYKYVWIIFCMLTITNMVLMQNWEIVSTTFDMCTDCVLKE